MSKKIIIVGAGAVGKIWRDDIIKALAIEGKYEIQIITAEEAKQMREDELREHAKLDQLLTCQIKETKQLLSTMHDDMRIVTYNDGISARSKRRGTAKKKKQSLFAQQPNNWETLKRFKR